MLNNKPFERFSFEREGVADFGNLSHLLQPEASRSLEALVRSAKRATPPRGGRRGQDWMQVRGFALAALLVYARRFSLLCSWFPPRLMLLRLLPQSLKPHEPPTLVLYTREEYRELAKALGIWEEAPRDTRSGGVNSIIWLHCV